jgi:hypothetical protein
MPSISLEKLKSMTGLIDAHRAKPNVSVEEHLQTRIAKLAQLVTSRRRIYLDTRYWILLRDASLNRAQQPIHDVLLDALRQGVCVGTMICPLSVSTYFELLRQSDENTRNATIRLMDELSQGVTIQNENDRLKTEILHFFTETIANNSISSPPISKVWTKIPYVLGTAIPSFPELSAIELKAIQKAFIDFMWTVSLEEMMTDTPLPEDDFDKELAEAACRISKKSLNEVHKIKNYRELFLAEIGGFFDIHRDILASTLETIYLASYPNAAKYSKEQRTSIANTFNNVFYNIFKYRKEGKSLPMAEIVSSLHAAIRWNKIQSFKSNDFFDIYHASAALAYCDVFLTEKFLATTLTRPPLSLDMKYGTTVVSCENEALKALKLG